MTNKTKLTLCIFLLIYFYINLHSLYSQKIIIESGFPGGNIIVQNIENDTINLRADQRDTRGYWDYFYFKISGITGKTIHFKFPKDQSFGKFGPAYSINNDHTWNWYGENSYSDQEFKFTFSDQDTVAYFSNGFPYTQTNLENFMSRISNGSGIRLDTLTFSKKNRAVEQIYLTPSKKIKYKVLVTARHHANEMMTNYLLEGLIESVLNEINLSFLRDSIEFMIIPFVDKDGVEDGDQGKNRIPWDHNRDYDENSLYPESQAIMKKIESWSENKLKIFLDLHCPLMTGYDASHIFLIGIKDPKIQEEEETFAELLDKCSAGDLKYYKNHLLKYSERWNNEQIFSEGTTSASWGATIPGISYSQTVEFPYANISGISVSKDGARSFGKSIAYAIQEYLLNLQ